MSKIRMGRSIESEDTGWPVGCELYCVIITTRLKGCFNWLTGYLRSGMSEATKQSTHLDEILVLDVDKHAGDVGSQDLGDNQSDVK